MNDLRELQGKLEKLKDEKWDNSTLEEKVDMLRDEIRQIAEKIELQECQKA